MLAMVKALSWQLSFFKSQSKRGHLFFRGHRQTDSSAASTVWSEDSHWTDCPGREGETRSPNIAKLDAVSISAHAGSWRNREIKLLSCRTSFRFVGATYRRTFCILPRIGNDN